ncbi:MAG: HAD family hydrolase [Rubrivivax sp.]|nr:HAD family hydrolase [Rubrivivax sp.]
MASETIHRFAPLSDDRPGREGVVVLATKTRAVFLDRDGTLIEERGYISDPSQVSLLPGTVEALRKLNKSPFLAIVVSNQSGVARGYFTEESVRTVNKHLRRLLHEEGVHLDGLYYCPHLPEAPVKAYRRRCRCRKPDTGMVERACRDFGIERTQSYLIGDTRTDVETAVRAGLTGILVLTGYGSQEWKRWHEDPTRPEPRRVCSDLSEAVEWILKKGHGLT